MYEVAFEMHLRERRRKWNFWPGGDPPHQHVSNALYERAESISLGPVLLSFPPIIVEIHRVVVEMYLWIPRNEWNGGATPPPTRVCNVPLCKKAESVSVGLGLLSFLPIAVKM